MFYSSSNGGATYIVREIIAKDSLNTENLMQTFENLLPRLLNKILRYCTQISPWVCVIKICSNGGVT